MERYYGSPQLDRAHYQYERHYGASSEYYGAGEIDSSYGGQTIRLPPNYLESSGQANQAKLRHQELALLQHYYGAAAGNGGAMKRPLETVANPGAFAPSLFVKRARSDMPPETSSRPQRPGEKECAFFMKTGSCSFGAACRFDHPPWVPPGGAPVWKAGSSPVGYPERPGEAECSFYMRTGSCKFGAKCKFHHPRDHNTAGAGSRGLETRVREEPLEAAIFAHHRQNEGSHYHQTNQLPPAVLADFQNGWGVYREGVEYDEYSRTAASNGLAAAAAAAVSAAKIALAVDDEGVRRGAERGGAYGTPAPLNSKGFPLRPDELECAFYMKSGSCKYGAVCKFHHPEGVAGTSPPAVLHGHQPHENAEMWLGGAAGFRQYPERPGQTECAFYMKTGTCKFGPGCKFHHPRVRPATAGAANANASAKAPAVPVKLTLAGLPRREGEVTCAYYMKTGACRYGAACKFDHPPPGEAAAKAAALAARSGSQELDIKEVQVQAAADMEHAVPALEHTTTSMAQATTEG